MQISKNFSLNEFERSMVAERKNIVNKASSGEIKNITELCYNVLEKVRIKFDEKPVRILSGLRVLELNRAIGSSDNSQHISAKACDFEIPKVSNLAVAIYISTYLSFDQLILEFWKKDSKDINQGWIHVSYDTEETNRKQVLTYDGKDYTNGLPDAKWSGGKFSN